MKQKHLANSSINVQHWQLTVNIATLLAVEVVVTLTANLTNSTPTVIVSKQVCVATSTSITTAVQHARNGHMPSMAKDGCK